MGDAAATVATLRPIADRPDADAYSLTLIGRALARQGEPPAPLSISPAPPGRSPARSPRSIRSARAISPRSARAADERSGDGPAQVRLISALLAPRPGDEALARARRLQADNPGAPEVHILVGDALGVERRFRRAPPSNIAAPPISPSPRRWRCA